MTDIETLNATYGITNQVRFVAGPGDMPMVVVNNAHAEAMIALQGAQVVSFQPGGGEPVLWTSAQSQYTPGKSIRGGIPLCWPWFGPHPSDPSKPQHGFVRGLLWDVLGAAAEPDGITEVRFGLHETPQTLDLWPHAFALEYVVAVGATLHATLIVRNTDDAPWTWTGALHSYFAVGDVRRVSIAGLEGGAYIDKVDGGARKQQDGPVRISGETDRVYLDTTATCAIDDPALGRRIAVSKQGSHSTVVWNPWAEKARPLADFGDDEYLNMVCVETSNALDDTVTLGPGAEYQVVAQIEVV